MSDNFTQPLRGDKFDASEWEGSLLLFFPNEYHSAIPTVNGDNAAVDTHIVVLDKGGKVLRDARVWGRALIPQLKGAIGGKPVLGRLAKGQATKGNNPPWVLSDFTDQDANMARQFMEQHGDLRSNPDAFTSPGGNDASGPPTSGVSAGTATASAATDVDVAVVAQLLAKGVDLSKVPPGTDLKLLLAAL